MCVILAALYRYYLHPSKASASVRHSVTLAIGLCVGYFVHGSHFHMLVIQATVSYAIMYFMPVKFVHICVFVVAMFLLSAMHILRIWFDFSHTIDISGSMMVCTTKITSLAFSLYDGKYRKESELTEEQKKVAVRDVPSPLEFYSYIFNFQGVLVGPLTFYREYADFIDGSNFNVNKNVVKNGHSASETYFREPSVRSTVAQKLSVAVIAAGIALFLTPHFPVLKNADPEFASKYGFLPRLGFLIVSVSLARPKYYFAWSAGESVNVASGLGFNGYGKDGNPKWDLINNVNIPGIELATSMKTYIDNWNTRTVLWLRYVSYNRVPYGKAFFTFVLSALWHGFFPGYYFTFLTGVLFTLASRKVRFNIRPFFLKSTSMKLIYDIFTWACTHIAIVYLVLPFTMLEFAATVRYYNSVYWWQHVVAGVIVLTFPKPVRKQTNPEKTKQS